MGHDVTDFQSEVIEASRTQPILVDFWAPWCGPCRTLGPVLEKLDAEAEGKWKLAKINTDQNQEVSASYGIRGIPAVKLFVDGEVVDEFTGALPEYAVRQWLDKALPSRSRNLLEEAETLIAEGSPAGATGLLEQVLAEHPTDPAGSALLASLVVFEDPVRATELAATGMNGEARHVQLSEAVRTLAAALATDVTTLPEEVGREPAAAALGALSEGELDFAIESLLVVLQQNRYFADDFARKTGVALFTVLGSTHPITTKHRRTFDMWLY